MMLVAFLLLLAAAGVVGFLFRDRARWLAAEIARLFHRFRARCRIGRLSENERCPSWLDGCSDLLGMEGYDVLGISALALALCVLASLSMRSLAFGLVSFLWNAPTSYFLWDWFFSA